MFLLDEYSLFLQFVRSLCFSLTKKRVCVKGQHRQPTAEPLMKDPLTAGLVRHSPFTITESGGYGVGERVRGGTG